MGAVVFAGASLGYLYIRREGGAGKDYNKNRQEYVYEASLHTDTDPAAHQGGVGHAWVNLRVTETVSDQDGDVVTKQATETVYDFAPKKLGYLQGTILKTPGLLLKQEKKGESTAPGAMESVAYYPITKEGYDRAKAWGDARVSLRGADNPLTPEYSVLRYNCVDFAIELVRTAGVEIPTDYAGWVSDPANLQARIKESNCQHDFEPQEIFHLGTGEGLAPPPTKIYVCKKCGLTRPY